MNSPIYTPGTGLARSVLEFFVANNDEVLDANDLVDKFDALKASIPALLKRARDCGAIVYNGGLYMLDNLPLLCGEPGIEWHIHILASTFFNSYASPTILSSDSIVFGNRRAGSLWAVMTCPRCLDTLVLAEDNASNAARSRPPADW